MDVNVGHAVLLGLLQGLTEFLPVSSSGHLALAQMMIPGFSQPGVLFDAMLHVGTASAVVWFERLRIVRWARTRDGRRLLGLLVLGTLATAVVGFALRGVATEAFHRAMWVGAALIVTGAVVASTRFLPGGQCGEERTGLKQVLAVGLVQGVAVFPGLSRSGLTIAAGLGSGLERSWAARFSFLLGVPAIAGATLVELVSNGGDVISAAPGFWVVCAVGMVAAGLSGYAALQVVLWAVSDRIFYRFSLYCIPLGILVVSVSSRFS